MVSLDSNVDNFSSSLFLFIIIRPRLGDPCVCQSPIGVYVRYFLGQVLNCAYTICSYGQIQISCTSSSGYFQFLSTLHRASDIKTLLVFGPTCTWSRLVQCDSGTNACL